MPNDPKLSAVGSLSIGGEATFGTISSYMRHVRVASIDISGLERVTAANEYTRQGDYETARLLGGSRGTITTRHRLHGYLSTIPSSAAALVDPATDTNATGWDVLLAAIASAFGQVYAAGYAGSQTVSADGTPTDTLKSTSLATFKAGMPICWATGTTRRAYEVGWLTAVNTAATPDEGSLLQAPRHDPQGDKVWGGFVAFLRDLCPYHDGTTKSFTLQWLGGASTDNYTMYGCQPVGLKVTFAVNQVPMLEITWGVAHWAVPGVGSGPESVQAWNYPEPEMSVDWQVAIGSGLDGDDVLYPVTKEVSFDLGLTRVALEGGHSLSGVEGWMATQRRPKLTVQVLWESQYHTYFADQQALPVTVTVGSLPGRIIALCLPSARLVSLPKRGDRDGATVMDLEFEAHYYDGDTSSDAVATYPRDSLARLAFL